MDRLPTELVLHIAHLTPTTALPHLARTSARICHIAQRVLYRHISASLWSRNLAVVRRLATRPHLARHVRSFYIALDPAKPVFASFYTTLAAALAHMTDLHSLHLGVDASASWVLPHLLPYSTLVHFTSTFPFDHNLARFLHMTPALRELEVDSIPLYDTPVPPLPPSAVPHLEQFIGSARAATLIVPGRPVHSIHLHGSTLADDDVALLARSTANVLVLGAVTNSPPVPFLQLLHRHLPRLAYLRVMSTQNLFKPPSPDFYEQVASVLASFTELNAFELSGMHWGSQRKSDDESKRIWQSSPLASGSLPSDELLFETDIFLAY